METPSELQQRALSLVSRDLAYNFDVLPLAFDSGTLKIGVVSVTNEIIEKVAQQTRAAKVLPVCLPIEKIRKELLRLYPPPTERAEEQSPKFIFEDVVRAALETHASDIHIQPMGPSEGKVWIRVDGFPKLHRKLSRRLMEQVLAYIKVQSKLDISESRAPQSGRLTVRLDGTKDVNIRSSFVSGIYGEKTALRLLGKLDLLPTIKQWQFEPEVVAQLNAAAIRASASFVVAGPTGSGKTTLIYTLLKEMDLGNSNPYSIEDPVEMLVPEMTQMEVNVKADQTFALSLRELMRQDPNLIFVGEIRDTETVNEYLKGSTSGLCLFSTVHAKSAPLIPDRFVELGGSYERVAATMTTGISLRLLRRLCERCRVPVPLSKAGREIAENKLEADKETVWGPSEHGCRFCDGIGYAGRFGVIEILNVSAPVQEVLRKHGSPREIVEAATGYRPMVVDGLRRVLAGDTSERELLRILAYEDCLS